MLIHNDKLFSQIDRVDMDIPLGPTQANWFLGMVEKKVLINIFCFINHFLCVMYKMCLPSLIHQQMFKLLLNVLNNQHPQPSFYM